MTDSEITIALNNNIKLLEEKLQEINTKVDLLHRRAYPYNRELEKLYYLRTLYSSAVRHIEWSLSLSDLEQERSARVTIRGRANSGYYLLFRDYHSSQHSPDGKISFYLDDNDATVIFENLEIALDTIRIHNLRVKYPDLNYIISNLSNKLDKLKGIQAMLIPGDTNDN